jgi:uncharacterized protein with FMN-binding domain
MKRAITTVVTIAILGSLVFYLNRLPDQTSSAAASPSTSTSNIQSTPSSPTTSPSKFSDGTYDGNIANTPYGDVQVAITISGGKITLINFLQMPNDQGHSREITATSEPLLKKSTLQAQSANIDFVSGATSTSYGYQQSLQAALDKASGSALLVPSQT